MEFYSEISSHILFFHIIYFVMLPFPHLLLDPFCNVDDTPDDTLLDKIDFPFASAYQFSDNFLVRDRTPCPICNPLSGMRHHLTCLCVCCHSVFEFVCIWVLLCLDNTVSLELPLNSSTFFFSF